MKKRVWKQLTAMAFGFILVFSLIGCVNQHPEETENRNSSEASGISEEAGETLESGASQEESRIVATTPSIMKICDMLELELVGIPDTSGEIPERYAGVTTVGAAMSPDLEIIASLEPTDVLMTGGGSEGAALNSMIPGQDEKLSGINLPITYLNVASVEGLYDTITELGEKYDRKELAEKYLKEYEEFMADYQKKLEGTEPPKVLILMGLPGSYIEATSNSYVGALVEMAGGINVVSDDSGEAFLTWNTERLYELEPDVILLTAHGLPEQAMEMFAEEFTTNTIWKNFRAVQEGKIYQLDYTIFNMSATFDWSEGLEQLYQIFYEGSYETYQPDAAQ